MKKVKKRKYNDSNMVYSSVKTYKRDVIQLITLILPAIILTILFSYFPKYGILLAFKDYKAPKGIWGSPWVGLDNFKFFLTSQDLSRIVRNTVGNNLLLIVTSYPMSILFAMLMFEVKKARHVKIYQTSAILPSFISTVVASYIVYALLEYNNGVITRLIHGLGATEVDFYKQAGWWPMIFVIYCWWHNTGMASILYYASLVANDPALYESARIDGAKKWQEMWYISLPHLTPILCIKLITEVGGILSADFGMFYNLPRNIGLLYPTTDVISTYVYRALMNSGDIGKSSAVGLFGSVVGLILLLLSNAVVKKISPENTLF